jgi:hypothetical protein
MTAAEHATWLALLPWRRLICGWDNWEVASDEE